MKAVQRKMFYLFSPFLRIFHWIMVDAIIVMFVTGILIAKPPEINALEPAQSMLLVNIIRQIHFLAAFGFCASFVFRV